MIRSKGLAALAVALGALAVPAVADAKANVTITGDTISNYAFSPKKVSIGKGAKVHWSWDSNAPHNVTFSKLGEHSATGASGSYKLKFKEAGTFKYHCTIHGISGKVVVG